MSVWQTGSTDSTGGGSGSDNDVDDEGALSTNASCGKRCVDSHPTCDVSADRRTLFCPVRPALLSGSAQFNAWCPASRDLLTERPRSCCVPS